MSEKIKVSVVVSVYNHDIQYLRKCLESLKNQKMFDDIEFIVIDNGATQDSKKVLEEFKKNDKRFKIIHFKKNLGYAHALNTGINEAIGEYIGIIESDDYTSPQMYEKLYNKIKEFDADVCIGGFYTVSENNINKYNKNCKLIFDNISDIKLFSIMDYPFLFTCHPSIWGKLYKADFIKQIGFNEKGRYIDSEFIVDLYCRTNKIIGIKEPLCYYRLDNPNASQSNERHDASLMDIIKDWKFAKESLKNYGYYNKLKNEFYYQSIKASFRFYQNISPFYRRAFFNKWRDFAKDLINDKEYDFKYFNEEQKEFLECVLANNYKGTLKFTKYNPTLKELIFKKRNTKMNSKKLIQNSINELKECIKAIEIKNSKSYRNIEALLMSNNLHYSTFSKYKNINVGKEIVIVACGPTAKYYTQLKDKIHIGANRAFLLNQINFDYLFVQSYLFGSDYMDMADEYRKKECKKFYGVLPNARLNEAYPKLKPVPFSSVIKADAEQYVVCKSDFWTRDISLQPIRDNGSTTFSIIQFALYTNPAKIYLVGCDCTNDNHFHEEDYEAYNNRFSTHYKDWVDLRTYIKEVFPDIEIITINPVKLKGVFNDVYTKNYIEEHPEINEENPVIIE